MEAFDEVLNGPLHEQNFVKDSMQNYFQELHNLNQRHCTICKELWPTTEKLLEGTEYICWRCKRYDKRTTPRNTTVIEGENEDSDEFDIEAGFHTFGVENDMIRNMDKVPIDIQIHLRKMTMIEEMLVAAVLPIMTVYRLPCGKNVSRGFVANFKQDSTTFIKTIPLTREQLPIVVIRRFGKNNTSADFKVNRARIEAVGKFLINKHPGYIRHGVTFSAENCQSLPIDGPIDGLHSIECEDDEFATDEGKLQYLIKIRMLNI